MMIDSDDHAVWALILLAGGVAAMLLGAYHAAWMALAGAAALWVAAVTEGT